MPPMKEVGIAPVLNCCLGFTLLHYLQPKSKLGINMGEVFVNVVRKLPLGMNLRPKERRVALEGEVRKRLVSDQGTSCGRPGGVRSFRRPALVFKPTAPLRSRSKRRRTFGRSWARASAHSQYSRTQLVNASGLMRLWPIIKPKKGTQARHLSNDKQQGIIRRRLHADVSPHLINDPMAAFHRALHPKQRALFF
jgi:hypothetical protein